MNYSEVSTNQAVEDVQIYKVPSVISTYDRSGKLIAKRISTWDFNSNTYTRASEVIDGDNVSVISNTKYDIGMLQSGMIGSMDEENSDGKKYLFEYDSKNKLIGSQENTATETIHYTNHYKSAEVTQNSENKTEKDNVEFDENGNIINNRDYDNYNNIIRFGDRVDMNKQGTLKYDSNGNILLFDCTDNDTQIEFIYNGDNFVDEIIYTNGTDSNDSGVYKIEYTDVTKEQYKAILELRLSYMSNEFAIRVDGHYGGIFELYMLYNFYKPIS